MFFGEKKIFVTAIDTDAGKTYVSAKLLNQAYASGIKAGYYKPVATGGIWQNDKLISEDVQTIKLKTPVSDSYDFINPVIYEMPAAPLTAAEDKDEIVDISLLDKGFHRLCQKYENCIVEGIGGLLVPITSEITVLDLIKRWELPVILVSTAKLGNINQTLLSLKVLKDAGVKVLGVVASFTDENDPGEAVRKSYQVIENISKIKILSQYPFEKDF